MKVIFDGRSLRMYPLADASAFSGGTERYIREIAAGLADKGHQVHVIANDLQTDEQRSPTLWYWGPKNFPQDADVVVEVHNLEGIATADFHAQTLLLATNGVDPYLGPDHAWASHVDGFPVFSETHKTLLCQQRPVDPEKCFVTGLGVDIEEYPRSRTSPAKHAYRRSKVPGRLFFANDPQRGLWHLLDIFEKLRAIVPDASLHVAYDFERQAAPFRYVPSTTAQMLLECQQRMEDMPGVRLCGALSRADLVREQLECHVHAMPSDPPNVGSQIHGISQMECAAAGTALVLSDLEAFPEVFGEVATVLPLPGTYFSDIERRYDAQDWSEVIADLMGDEAKWREASRKARALAEQHTWDRVVDRWDGMLAALTQREAVAA